MLSLRLSLRIAILFLGLGVRFKDRLQAVCDPSHALAHAPRSDVLRAAVGEREEGRIEGRIEQRRWSGF